MKNVFKGFVAYVIPIEARDYVSSKLKIYSGTSTKWLAHIWFNAVSWGNAELQIWPERTESKSE